MNRYVLFQIMLLCMREEARVIYGPHDADLLVEELELIAKDAANGNHLHRDGLSAYMRSSSE